MGRRSAGRPLGPPGFVELCVDGTSRFGGDPWATLELLLRGRDETLRGAEVLQKGTAAGRAHTFQLVEDGRKRPRVPSLAVEADGKAVRLVPDPLEQLETGRVRREPDSIGLPGNEHLLYVLRQRDHRHPGQVEGLHRRERSGQLALAPV